MKLSKSKSHYGNNIPTLTEIHPANQSQSRPRVVLLLVLLSIVTALLTVISNVFAPIIDLGSDYHLSKDRYRATQQQTIEDPYNRKIRVLEHREEHVEDSDYEYDDYEYFDEDANIDADEESDDEDDLSYNEYDWSEEQIDEMERYYKRYLEVFYEKHGYGYEPEDIEVVYTEYLKFKEQKAQERLEMEQENEQAQPEPQEPEGTSSLESYEVQVTQYPDSTIVKHDPYYLEMEWEDFNEVGGDHFASNNCTETLTIGSVPTTIVVVDRSSIKDDSMGQQPLSGRGQVYNV